MPYFFFSYACANAQGEADACVSKFFDDLVFEIEQKAQPPVQGQIGFRDWDNIGTGDILPRKLIDGLRTCKIFVPLYSPLYFTREACGMACVHRTAGTELREPRERSAFRRWRAMMQLPLFTC